jgi:glycosyltransferase involved in cell wall biosynthesis
VSCFCAQTYAELELLILDDSEAPSALFKSSSNRDPRIHYSHMPRRMTIGEKRNWLIEQSRGAIIVQFDDDDYYAPRYVERMVQNLGDDDLTKLGGWFGFSVAKSQFFYWDTARTSNVHIMLSPVDAVAPVAVQHTAAFIEDNLWGYGFSYVYRKRVFDAARFEALNWREDRAFMAAVRAAGCKVSHFPDDEGLALHILHGNNTSRAFPQYLLPPVLMHHFFPHKLRAYLEAGKR